jgi:GalNAc-alpha-(1->4)-GalNAc-alpha-(1->3)-diNAcBac-PP-undecaprenol alpha-1,4-N-acetyl-D-galactosaminyltransferase
MISSFFFKIPIVISERNNPEVSIPKFYWRVLRNFFYSFTDVLVVQTGIVKIFYQKRVKDSKIIVIPNPVSKDLISLSELYGKKKILF